MLIASRAVQGIGAAIISPAALSIVTTTFSEGAERNKALGIWGALGGSGAAVGVLFGGILTKYLGWEWIFFVNVPVGALVFALTWPIVPESHADLGHRRFDAGRRRERHRRARAARVRDLEGAGRRLGDRPDDRPARRAARGPGRLRRLGAARDRPTRPVRRSFASAR